MIDTIIFDFGNIFVNLNPKATEDAFRELGLSKWTDDLIELNHSYEFGKIDELQFIKGIQKHIPTADLVSIRQAWNAQIADFPLKRLEFLQFIRPKFKLFLLSNADQTHIDRFEHKEGISFSRDFYSCFEKTYFSFDIHMRKPDKKVFQLILNNHNISPRTTLFVDDTKANIESAKKAGLNTWHLNPEKEDVTQLFDYIKNLHD